MPFQLASEGPLKAVPSPLSWFLSRRQLAGRILSALKFKLRDSRLTEYKTNHGINGKLEI
jgi:hypothetical protein